MKNEQFEKGYEQSSTYCDETTLDQYEDHENVSMTNTSNNDIEENIDDYDCDVDETEFEDFSTSQDAGDFF